jgi:hypothetical protein
MNALGVAALSSKLTHPQDLDVPLRLGALRKINSLVLGNSTLTIRTFLFSPPLPAQAHRILVSSFSTGPAGDRGALHCHWNSFATEPLGLVSVSPRGLLPNTEEQSRTRGGQSGGVEDQPQYGGLWRGRTPNARSLSRSPSDGPFFSPPFFHTISHFPAFASGDGQTSPHKPRLVVSHSTCPPLSPSPLANSFIIGTAVINSNKWASFLVIQSEMATP